MPIHSPEAEATITGPIRPIGIADNKSVADEDKRKRRRRDRATVREAAVRSARRILADAGPRGVTLKAVAQDLGMRHGNLTYHFGSAAGLQSAVLEALGEEVIGGIGDAVRRLDDGGATEREIVDLIFDAIASTGLIRLVSWLVSTGAADQMAPFDRVLAGFIRRRGDEGSPHAPADVARMVMAVLVPALGAALMGTNLSRMLGLPDDAPRALAAAQLRALRTGGG